MLSFEKDLCSNINTHKKLLNIESHIKNTIEVFFKTLKKNNSIFICGNGGSESDAEHLSTEALVRLNPKVNRRPYKIINLGMNLSYLTACSNDYSFDEIFTRSFEALVRKGDVLWVLSTSGNSRNIINVLKMAQQKKIFSVAFLGKNGGKCKKISKLPLMVDSNNTARIQEAHIFLGHYILKETEKLLIKK
jgi:D-sedoheptulose 7-phosphate isomerase